MCFINNFNINIFNIIVLLYVFEYDLMYNNYLFISDFFINFINLFLVLFY